MSRPITVGAFSSPERTIALKARPRRWLFAAPAAVADVWSAGRLVVRDGRHVARDAVADRYRIRLRRLVARF